MKLFTLILLIVASYGVSAQCSTPTGLSTTGITTSSSTANWNAVSGALSYDVDYQASSWGYWINIAAGTTSTSWDLLGMPAATTFNWRVKANCSSGSSSYAQTTFTTLSSQTGSCSAPTGLATSGISATAATATWAAVSGATSYDIEYKPASSSTWTTFGFGTNGLQWTLSNLAPSTSYNWRVKANCSSGSSSYTQTQFTTGATGSCSAPGSLSTSNITGNTVTMNWGAVSGAFSYAVEYKPTSSGSWLYATTGTAQTYVNLYSLAAATTYDWRVTASCSLTEVSSYSFGQFTTSGGGGGSTPPPIAPGCPGPDDISTNGTTSGAALIPLNSDSKGTIASRNDIDHYMFVISTGGFFTVSLTTLPANYNLAVLNNSGNQIGISQNNGTQSEMITLNLAAGTYYAKVFPKGNVSSTSCYTLRVQ